MNPIRHTASNSHNMQPPYKGELFPGDRKVYNEVLSSAHREPTHSFRAPLLTRHLSLWMPKELPDDEPEAGVSADPGQRVNAFVAKVYRNLNSGNSAGVKKDTVRGLIEEKLRDGKRHILLFGAYIGDDCEPKYINSNLKNAKISETSVCGLVFNWWGIKVTLRFELHTEYLMLTTFLDLSQFVEDDELAGLRARQGNGAQSTPTGLVFAALESLDDLVEAHRKLYVDSNEEGGEIEKYGPITDALALSTWKRFDDDILKDAYPSFQGETALGSVFGDFRGIVLSRPVRRTVLPKSPDIPPIFEVQAISEEADKSHFPTVLPKTQRMSGRYLQLPFWRVKGLRAQLELQQSDDQQLFVEPFRRRELEKIRLWFWPFLKASILDTVRSQYEYIACGMHGGRALYVSALGARPVDEQREQRFPITYFLYTEEIPSWQLGRLLDRIHRLGTLRSAAVLGFGHLLKAAYNLRLVEKEISRAKMVARAKGVSVEEFEKIMNDIEDKILEADKECGRLGPLEYRLERSRYYIRKFRENVKRLRIVRLEGFQQYDEFVERRLGAAFEFTELLLERSRRIREERDSLLELYQTLRIGETERKIETLQRGAEAGFLIVLLPYYLGHVLGEVMPFSKEAWPYLSLAIGLGLYWKISGKHDDLKSQRLVKAEDTTSKAGGNTRKAEDGTNKAQNLYIRWKWDAIWRFAICGAALFSFLVFVALLVHLVELPVRQNH